MATRKPATKSSPRTGKATAPTKTKAPAKKSPAAPGKTPPAAKPGPKGPTKWTPEAIAEEGRALLAWLLADEKRFWLNDFAIEQGYSGKQRFAEWRETSLEFSDLFQRAKEIQESRLFRMGVDLRNQTLVGLALRNFHGWVDKVDVNADVNHKRSVRDLSEEEIDALILERAGGAKGKRK